MNGEIRGLRWQFDSAPCATVLDAVFSRPWEAADRVGYETSFSLPPLSLPCVVPNIVFHSEYVVGKPSLEDHIEVVSLGIVLAFPCGLRLQGSEYWLLVIIIFIAVIIVFIAFMEFQGYSSSSTQKIKNMLVAKKWWLVAF